MATAFRIVQKKWVKGAFTGEGARIHGGRWNSPGTPMIYLSEDLSLAVLEIFVHLQDWECVMSKYCYFRVQIPEAEIEELPKRKLFRGWDHEPPGKASQLVGDAWVKKAESLALRVPSVVVPPGRNLLLNPLHPAFKKISKHGPLKINLDNRILKNGATGKS